MWAASLEGLADETELHFGWSCLEESWNNLPKNTFDPHTVGEIDNVFRQRLDKDDLDSAFVLSTSIDRDSPHMWKEYAGGSGFCVELMMGAAFWRPKFFMQPVLAGKPAPEGESVLPGWRRVVYDPAEQRKLALDRVTWVAKNWVDVTQARLERPPAAGDLTAKYVLLTNALLLKPACFAPESEVRFIGGRPPSVQWSVRPGGRKYVPIVATAEAMCNGDQQTWIAMSGIVHSPDALVSDVHAVRSACEEMGYTHVVVVAGRRA